VLVPVPVLDDRAEVHQATGVVSVQAGVGLAEALVLLRARAFADHRPIGDLACDVLAGTADFRNVGDSG
jgi:AmiR/NasT family two-component response regulator